MPNLKSRGTGPAPAAAFPLNYLDGQLPQALHHDVNALIARTTLRATETNASFPKIIREVKGKREEIESEK
jgi:hypothetical protein